MRRKTGTLRTVFVVALTAALAGACWAGSARYAAAFFRMGGGHFGGARISGHSSGARYGVRMHGGDRISHGRHRAELPSRGSEGRGGRGPRHFPHRLVLGHGNGNGNGGRPGLLAPGGSGGGGLSGGGRIGGVPPAGERRFVPDEVVVEFHPRVSPQTIARFARIFNLTQLESHSFALLGGATFYRWRITPGSSVPGMVSRLQNQVIVANAQPNYLYTVQDDVSQTRPAAAGDEAQYALRTLQINQAQQIATGKDVIVAVIDSEVEASHPDLAGSIKKKFDALGGAGSPQSHGTAMAGAIAAHGKLLGIAPGAAIVAARAFDDSRGEAKGTSFAIYKSLQWAADSRAGVVNMSFVGPFDPDLSRMLASAGSQGIVLIAAGGNGGPDSGPQYPASDANVIAVAATDGKDGLFPLDNRNPYIVLAAPGVDILSLAPDHAYQESTGSSIAAAQVSGIVALMLQVQPSLKPRDVRAILTDTAKPLAASENSSFEPRLVNAYLAVKSAEDVVVSGVAGHEQAKR
ncbi:MAG TPA: S8 family serine peptidase [Xanthobacteraceae bacterium]|nr:S8 family serine peptidase [Xanthobacteraceae bacterium]